MAVHAQFGGLLAGRLSPFVGGGLAGEQMRALLSGAGDNKGHQYHFSAGVVSAAQSELTCNGGCAGAAPPRKRGREDELDFEQYVASSSAALLPIPGTQQVAVAQQQSPAAVANRTLDSALTSTSGRSATTASAVEDALVSELCRQGAAIDALVRSECERIRAGLEQARKRQCQALVRAAAAAAERLLRAKEAELDAARRRAAILDERLRQAVAESQAWCGLARRNEAVASGLRAALDTLLLGGGGGGGGGPAQPAEEGFGESDPADAVSCYIGEAEYAGACAATSSSSAASNGRACRACGGGEASVLVLPCRHLCLCKACEPRADACPVCLAAKNASIHVAAE